MYTFDFSPFRKWYCTFQVMRTVYTIKHKFVQNCTPGVTLFKNNGINLFLFAAGTYKSHRFQQKYDALFQK